jgi:hypothetical protein
MRRPDVSVSDGMINAVLNVVVHADDGERDQALRWAARRLAKSSLSHDAAVELLDGLRRNDKPPLEDPAARRSRYCAMTDATDPREQVKSQRMARAPTAERIAAT